RTPDVAREREILVPIGFKVIVEDAADAARFVPVLDEEILVAPFREAVVVIGPMRVAGGPERSMEQDAVGMLWRALRGDHRGKIAAAAEPGLPGDDVAGVEMGGRH